MAKKSKKGRFGNFVLLAVILVIIGIAWGVYRLVPRESANIFVVTTPLQSGETTVTGTLEKDTPLGEFGNYFVVTDDQQVITLESVNLDNLVGQKVEATGNLQFTAEDNPYLIDKSITVIK